MQNTDKVPNNVAHPSHYTSGAIEVKDFTNAWNMNFNLGNVLKYIVRAGRKKDVDPLEDLQKARQYIDFEIERVQAAKGVK